MSICPCYNNLLAEKDSQLGRDWRQVTLQRRNRDGSELQTRTYIEEISTGDLYNSYDSPSFIAQKAFRLLFGIPFYMAAVMCANLVKIITSTVNIIFRVVFEFAKTWNDKGAIEAFATVFYALSWEIPTTLANNIWRIIKAPLYAVALCLATPYALLSPYEGRKWIAKVESSWHEGTDYRNDYCYLTDHTCSEKSRPTMIKGILAGKIYFLALCMQPIGNIKDKVGDLDRFVRVVPA